MSDMTGWLVETRGTGETQYLTFYGSDASYGVPADGHFGWGSNPNFGLRFAREEDASRFIGAMRGLMDRLPYRETIRGLRRDDAPVAICEHRWIDAPSVPSNQEPK